MTAHETLARIARNVLREKYASIEDQADAMAAAMITGLGLTEEWCVELEIGPEMGRIKCEPTPFPPRGELRHDDVTFSRLVTPWESQL